MCHACQGARECNRYPITRCPPRLPLGTSLENHSTSHPMPAIGSSAPFEVDNENAISRWLDEEEALIGNDENKASSSMEAFQQQVRILSYLDLDASLTGLPVSIIQHATACSANSTTSSITNDTITCTTYSINNTILSTTTATNRFVGGYGGVWSVQRVLMKAC